MLLTSLTLSQFRNYSKRTFALHPTTIIIGDNAIGKTNILEAIAILSRGKSFRAEQDHDSIQFGQDFAKVSAIVGEEGDETYLDAIFAKSARGFSKKFLVNKVPKRLADFVGHLPTTIFTPQDIEMITASPSSRRRYIDVILYQSSKSYRLAYMIYEKALKARNHLLRDIRDEKKQYRAEEFTYWDTLLLEHAQTITSMREELVNYLNHAHKELFPIFITYDHSKMTVERLEKYHTAELGAGITLIGPQRDDFLLLEEKSKNPISEFCSRGEQRLSVVQLKMLEIQYLEQVLNERPLLLLDDIFSELDQKNIERILRLIPYQQTLVTTTHEEFIPIATSVNTHIIHLP
jgi:DNA replication and repair protein RecF